MVDVVLNAEPMHQRGCAGFWATYEQEVRSGVKPVQAYPSERRVMVSDLNAALLRRLGYGVWAELVWA